MPESIKTSIPGFCISRPEPKPTFYTRSFSEEEVKDALCDWLVKNGMLLPVGRRDGVERTIEVEIGDNLQGNEDILDLVIGVIEE